MLTTLIKNNFIGIDTTSQRPDFPSLSHCFSLDLQ